MNGALWRPAALIAVDVSPRWLRGHTRDGLRFGVAPDPAAPALSLVHERLGALLDLAAEAQAVPVLVVEGEQLARLRLEDLVGRPVALCGCYGELCVLDAALTLATRGVRPVLLEDACLWTKPLDEVLTAEPRLAKIRRCRAVALFPELARMQPDLWAGPPPHTGGWGDANGR